MKCKHYFNGQYLNQSLIQTETAVTRSWEETNIIQAEVWGYESKACLGIDGASATAMEI